MDTMTDREAIRDLTDRFGYYADTFQFDLLMTLWADDGVFDETAAGNARYSGQASIRKFFDGVREMVSHMAHFVASQIIEEITDCSAKGIVFTYVRAKSKSAGNIEGCCYYEDDYVKKEGRWVFKSRVLRQLLPTRIEERDRPS